jgi:hypothetical protein
MLWLRRWVNNRRSPCLLKGVQVLVLLVLLVVFVPSLRPQHGLVILACHV